MKKGQVLLLFAFLLPVALLLLALVVELGRTWVTRARLQRSAQAAVDAGVSVAGEQLATLAVGIQTQTALPSTRIMEPALHDLPAWLTDDARATLTAPELAAAVVVEGERFAAVNGLAEGEGLVEDMTWTYPQPGYRPDDAAITELRLTLRVVGRMELLLGGWLQMEAVNLPVEAAAAIPQR